AARQGRSRGRTEASRPAQVGGGSGKDAEQAEIPQAAHHNDCGKTRPGDTGENGRSAGKAPGEKKPLPQTGHNQPGK
ncbi:MAG: hypothetical protein KDG51_10700, partial [Calditrichaeota bacterium]|nr:hypothetical protein [Calditrichota bacterium]